jgi:phosphoribosylcarboxyaminoimidazole (NCAIR) mutase
MLTEGMKNVVVVMNEKSRLMSIKKAGKTLQKMALPREVTLFAAQKKPSAFGL